MTLLVWHLAVGDAPLGDKPQIGGAEGDGVGRQGVTATWSGGLFA